MTCRALISFGVAASLTLAAARSRADHALDVTTREDGPWAQTIRRLQASRTADGTAVHVRVLRHAGGARLGCAQYALSLDAAATEAFDVGPCDEATGETTLTLVKRRGLFDLRGAVPTPI